jgi:chromosome segregation ATPase
MGTAFASLVAGALIVLTAFDEIQVTKVDSISGIIREIRSEIQSWGGDQAFSGTNTQLLGKTKTQVTEALDEAKEYVSYLEKKSLKQQEQSGESVTEYQNRERDRLLNALSTIKATSGGLEELRLRLENLRPQAQDSQVKATVAEAIRLTLQTKLEKARMYSFELMSHLKSKSKESKNSVEHYQELIKNITTLNNQLASLNAASSLHILDNELTTIEKDILPLTKQTPYTLLMMRVVEIGLPLLLGIFSIFFLLRYSLTEKRSQEIKNLLKQRNEELSKEANKATGSATV